MGPAQFGAVVYARDVSKLARFYRPVFGMRFLRETPDLIGLDMDGFNIVIHAPPGIA